MLRQALATRPSIFALMLGAVVLIPCSLARLAGQPLVAGMPTFARLLFGLTAAATVNAGGFDAPEDAVRGLEQAYIQKDLESAVAAMDFVEEGRQMLQKINPTLANDPAMIKQAAEGRELAFRTELRTKGFPESSPRFLGPRPFSMICRNMRGTLDKGGAKHELVPQRSLSTTPARRPGS